MQPTSLGQAPAIPNPAALELVFRTNVTPEITIDISSILSSGKTPPAEAVTGNNKLALQLIKPEVIFEAFQNQKSIAPYGSPQTGTYLYVIGLLASSSLLGAVLTFGICRNPKKWIPITGIISAGFIGFTLYQIR